MKPWYKIITPREDLRDGRPLDASEFAVHLDHVRDGRAPAVYQNPAEFFERTYLTKNLRELAAAGRCAVCRREARDLRHLQPLHAVRRRQDARADAAVPPGTRRRGRHRLEGRPDAVLSGRRVIDVPTAATAVFVGTEFDSITGRGGDDGTPLRKTPWGEIAFQLGGRGRLRSRRGARRDADGAGGRRRAKLLPKDRPVLILYRRADELRQPQPEERARVASSTTSSRTSPRSPRGRDNVVLAVSIPASELEMTAGGPVGLRAVQEAARPPRQGDDHVGRDRDVGDHPAAAVRVGRPSEGRARRPSRSTTPGCRRTSSSSRAGSPSTTPGRPSRPRYPFHPSVLSVFERKWQAPPAVPADARRAAPPRALGVEGVQRGLQGRPQGPADHAGDGAAGRRRSSARRSSSSSASPGSRRP